MSENLLTGWEKKLVQICRREEYPPVEIKYMIHRLLDQQVRATQELMIKELKTLPWYKRLFNKF